jgi:hypothetical protein
MGVNNHLLLNLGDGGEPEALDVQFRWGDVFELRYKVGDRLVWDRKPRPPSADGAVEVRGLALVDHGDAHLRYFNIQVENDVIISAREIDEAAYDAMG